MQCVNLINELPHGLQTRANELMNRVYTQYTYNKNPGLAGIEVENIVPQVCGRTDDLYPESFRDHGSVPQACGTS